MTPLPEVVGTEIPYWSAYAAAALLIAWGGILCIWGYRLFRVTLAAYGFVFGAVALGMLAERFGGIYGAVIGAVVGGITGAVLSYFIMYVWVFMLGAGFGLGIMVAAGWIGTWVLWSTTFAVALLFGVLALKYVRALIVVLTAITGSAQIVWGILLMTGVQINQDLLAVGKDSSEISALFAKYHLAVIGWFALAVISATFQYAMSYRHEIAARKEQTQRKQNVAGLAPSGSPLPPQMQFYEQQIRVPGRSSKVPYIRIALVAIYLLLALWGAYYEYTVQDLLKQARTRQQAGQVDEARTLYVRVVEEYPLSYGFVEARQNLLALAKDGQVETSARQPLPQLARYVSDIHYWLPLFACAGSGLAAMGVFLTRLKKPFTAILAGIIAGAASFGVLVQIEGYNLKLLAPLEPISEALLKSTKSLYVGSYALLILAAFLTLTPMGTRKAKRA